MRGPSGNLNPDREPRKILLTKLAHMPLYDLSRTTLANYWHVARQDQPDRNNSNIQRSFESVSSPTGGVPFNNAEQGWLIGIGCSCFAGHTFHSFRPEPSAVEWRAGRPR